MSAVAKMSNEDRLVFLDQKLEELAKKQEENLVADFDAALDEYEQEHKPLIVKFGGKFHEIPRNMPFNFTMFYMRHCIKRRGGKTFFEIPDDKIGKFLELMLGPRFARDIENSKADVNFVLSKIVPSVLKQWGIDLDGDPGAVDSSPQK